MTRFMTRRIISSAPSSSEAMSSMSSMASMSSMSSISSPSLESTSISSSSEPPSSSYSDSDRDCDPSDPLGPFVSACCCASAYLVLDSAQSTATGLPAMAVMFTSFTARSASAFDVNAAKANPFGLW